MPKRITLPSAAKRRRVIAVVPSLLTLGNAVCGFGAITYAAKVGPDPIAVNFMCFAAILIYVAMLFDVLDGAAARLAKQTSDFGAQLDSLCDAISFGVAPAFLMLKFSTHLPPRLLWVIAVLYTICAVLRLARYNVLKDSDASTDFRGLPSPAAAGMVASLVVIGPGLARLTGEERTVASQRIGELLSGWTTIGLPYVTLAVALLMVSRVRYPHVAKQLLKGRRSFQHLVKLIFAIVAVFAVHELAIPLIFAYYVASAPLAALWGRLRGNLPPGAAGATSGEARDTEAARLETDPRRSAG